MIITLHTWTPADKPALMALCNAVDRTFLSDRLPYPYDEADADWWLGMVAENEGKDGVWRAIVVDGQIVGSISVERKADENYAVGAIGYMILTPFWSQGIGTEAVRQICGIAFRELALERIIGEVFPENLASARVLEKNGFRLEETKVGAVVKGEKAMDVRVYCYKGTDLFLL
ncbi:MAG: GNAT family N-acetyltransferase [Bacteroidales bacterium]|nr:GNAT family N-acetyltransferase [Bacteroidales bacterium]